MAMETHVRLAESGSATGALEGYDNNAYTSSTLDLASKTSTQHDEGSNNRHSRANGEAGTCTSPHKTAGVLPASIRTHVSSPQGVISDTTEPNVGVRTNHTARNVDTSRQGYTTAEHHNKSGAVDHPHDVHASSSHITPPRSLALSCQPGSAVRVSHQDLDVRRSPKPSPRSRRHAVSDAEELTSPDVPSRPDTWDLPRRSMDSYNVDCNETVQQEPRGSLASEGSRSSVSMLRQTSSFSLQFSPSPDDVEIGNAVSCDALPKTKASMAPPYVASFYDDFNVTSAPRDAPEIQRPVVRAAVPNTSRRHANQTLHPAPQLSRTRSQIDKAMKNLRVPRDSEIRRIVRQISGLKDDSHDVDVTDYGLECVVVEGKRPKSYFDLAVMTFCCCVSPLGCVAVVMSVLSAANYKANHRNKAKRYGQVSLLLSIVGMITTVGIAVALLLIFAYPWNQTHDP